MIKIHRCKIVEKMNRCMLQSEGIRGKDALVHLVGDPVEVAETGI
jgi:hypothetical protein